MSTNVTKPLLADSFVDLATATVSSEDASHPKALGIDNDRTSYWESEGSDDVTVETFELDFGQTVNIDFFALIGINLKAFTVQYWTGAAWAAFTSGTFTGHADDHAIIMEAATQATTKIRVRMTTTQIVDAEKQIAEIIIGGVLLETWYENFRERDVEKAGMQRTAKRGNADSWFEWSKRGWILQLQYKTEAERQILRALKDAHEDFIWYPEPEIVPGEVFLAEWMNRWDRRYTSKNTAAGSTIPINLEEK